MGSNASIYGCENIFVRMKNKDSFVKKMSWEVEKILSNIRRDLFIEKDENLLLRKKKDEES